MKQNYIYENFKCDVNKLIKMLKNENYDAIVGISRGGLTLAHCLGEGLEIRDVQTIRTELYDGECKREEITLFGSCFFDGHSKVLVVDDIADSGKTLEFVMEHLEEAYPSITFDAATLFYKPTSVYEPKYWLNTARKWIVFFWEADYM